MEKVAKAFEKGIPSGIDIYLTFYDMLNLSDSSERTNMALLRYFNQVLSVVSKMVGRNVGSYYGNRMLCVGTDLNTLEKNITVHPEYISMMLALCLNVNGAYNKMIKQDSKSSIDFGTKEEVLERIELLKTIKSGKQLKANFPGLDASWRNTKKFIKNLLRLKKSNPAHYQEMLDIYCITDTDVETMSGFENLDFYIKYTCEAFSGLVKFEDFIKDAVKETKIGKDVFEYISQEKLELFIAAHFADAAEATNDLDFKQRCLYYLSTYMFENKDSLDDGLTVDVLIRNMNGKAVTDTVSKRSLYERFKRLLVDNPSLYNVNFDSHIFSDMNIDEINKLMAEYMKSLKLKWELIEDGNAFYAGILKNHRASGGGRESSSSARVKQNPVDLFMEKKEFFDSSDPYLRVVGKNTFDGYVGYIYPNGTVILDKFYENARTKKLATEQAIYCMSIDDFYTYSQLSKTTIIANRLCKRFYHRGDWQSRVKKEITGCADLNTGRKSRVLELLNALK